MRIRASAVVLAVAGIGCFTPESGAQVQGSTGGGGTTRRAIDTSEGNGGSAGSSNRGSASSGGSSSDSSCSSTSSGGSASTGAACGASGGASGSNQIFDCSNIDFYSGDGGGCPAAWLGSQVDDFESCSPICGATVQAQDRAGVTVAGTEQLTQAPGGSFRFCLPADTTFETLVSAPGYPNFVYAEITGQLAVDIPMIGLLSTDELAAFQVFINGGLNPADGALVAFFVNVDDCADGPGTAEDGWTLTLQDESCAPYPDGGYQMLYIDSAGFPNPTLTQTSPYGVAILYNIDPSVAQFPKLVATNPAAKCQLVNQAIGFTGNVQVGPGFYSEVGFFLE